GRAHRRQPRLGDDSRADGGPGERVHGRGSRPGHPRAPDPVGGHRGGGARLDGAGHPYLSVSPIRLALLAMGSGMAFGLFIVSLTVLGVDVVRPSTPPPSIATGPAFYLLVFGTLSGLVLAGVVAWCLLPPIVSTYRRGGISVVTACA